MTCTCMPMQAAHMYTTRCIKCIINIIMNSQFHDNDEVPSTFKSIMKFDNMW